VLAVLIALGVASAACRRPDQPPAPKTSDVDVTSGAVNPD
jgi:hypothetical protein